MLVRSILSRASLSSAVCLSSSTYASASAVRHNLLAARFKLLPCLAFHDAICPSSSLFMSWPCRFLTTSSSNSFSSRLRFRTKKQNDNENDRQTEDEGVDGGDDAAVAAEDNQSRAGKRRKHVSARSSQSTAHSASASSTSPSTSASASASSPRRRPRAVSQWTELDLLQYLNRSADLYLGRFSSSSGNLKQVLKRRVLRLKVSLGLTVDPTAPGVNVGIEKIVADKVASGIINDKTYSQSMVSAMRDRGCSSRKILQKLLLKGIPGDLAKEQIAAHGHQTAQHQQLQESLNNEQSTIDDEEPDPEDVEVVSSEGVAMDEYSSALHLAKKLSLGRFRSAQQSGRGLGRLRAPDGSKVPRTPFEWQQRDLAKLVRHGFSFDVAKRVLTETEENRADN